MKSFLCRWFWEGKQKWLVLFSFVSFCAWIGAYSLIYYWVPTYCVRQNNACFDFWLESLGAPFYGGYFLKALIVSPLLLLPCSKSVFKVWFFFSVVCIPVAFFSTVNVPIYFILDKLAMSHLWGIIFFLGTLTIIFFVPLAEWLYKKYKARR